MASIFIWQLTFFDGSLVLDGQVEGVLMYVLEVCPKPPLESEAVFGTAFCVVLVCAQTGYGLSSPCSLLKLGTVQY